jgi:hypothetical protein
MYSPCTYGDETFVAVAASASGVERPVRKPLVIFPSWKNHRFAAFSRERSFVENILFCAKKSEISGRGIPPGTLDACFRFLP